MAGREMKSIPDTNAKYTRAIPIIKAELLLQQDGMVAIRVEGMEALIAEMERLKSQLVSLAPGKATAA